MEHEATTWTTAQLAAAKDALRAAMPGLEIPLADGLAVGATPTEATLVTANRTGGLTYAALALALTTGYCHGSAAIELDQRGWARALSTLRMAGACRSLRHPNLEAWEQLDADLRAGAHPAGTRLWAVFAGTDADAPGPDGAPGTGRAADADGAGGAGGASDVLLAVLRVTPDHHR